MIDINEQYAWIADRFAELTEAVAQPETLANQTLYQRLLKERAALEPAVFAWNRWQELLRQEQEAEALSRQPDMMEIAQEELRSLAAEKEALEEQLRLLLLPKDPDDERSVVLEIRAGAGGDEACLFGADLLRMYLRWAERSGYRAEPVSENMTELGGVKEAVVLITGRGVYSRLKYESGVHRVQRVPVTESSGKIQTSTCTVAILPEAEDVELTIDPKDLRIDVYRSTGHGGQCINTTDSAVRITHLPTGLVVTCQDQKSQLKNRDQAMKVLRSRLLSRMREEKDAAYADRRKQQVGTGDRSERIRSYHFPQSRVTDHRIGLTIHPIEAIMDGGLDPLIDALRMDDQRRQLAALGTDADRAKEGLKQK